MQNNSKYDLCNIYVHNKNMKKYIIAINTKLRTAVASKKKGRAINGEGNQELQLN